MEIVSISDLDVIQKAVAVLQAGGLVIYPTETVYGIGADATSQKAVDKLLQYKARREGKPLSIAVGSVEMADQYVEINAVAKNLYTNFLPGPLTVVSKGKSAVAVGVESEIGTLGIRIPDYELIIDIIKTFGFPITSTSANASYKKRPYTVADVLDSISVKQKDLIDLIIDAGTLPKREPSTVVDTTLNQEVVLRQGTIKLTDVLKMETHSAEETQQLGYELMSKYYHYIGYKSVIFALQGELGAGKTQLTKGVAQRLGISAVIDSPTFIIQNEYEIAAVADSHMATRKQYLYHIDTWRLFEQQELVDLEFLELVYRGNVFVVEWANKVAGLIEQVSADAVIVWVKMAYGDVIDTRTIEVSDFVPL